MNSRTIAILALPLAALVAVFASRSAAEEDGAKPQPIRGIVYSVWHGDSIHRIGGHIPEVHVPQLGLSFHLEFGELRVFRPEHPDVRYGTRKSITFESTDQRGNRQELEVPIIQLAGMEPRKVREIEIEPADARLLTSFLALQDRVKGVARKYAK